MLLFFCRLAIALTVLTVYAPRAAHANGRFPAAQAIVTTPGSADGAIFLRTTFGVLVSRDAGKTWQWMCEQALGFSGTWDPPLAVTGDGKLWIGLSDGLRSTADACESAPVLGLDGEYVADLTTDPKGTLLVALTSTPSKDGHVVYLDKNGRAEIVRGGVAHMRLETVEIAPSRPSRFYVTGEPEGKGARARFFRGERSAEMVELHPTLPFDARLFIAAVDPKNPDRVFVRALHAGGSDVLLTEDGGATFRSVLHMGSSMFGFAKSEDGAVYWAGSGDPADGIWRSRDRGLTWAQVNRFRVLCLHARGDKLFACSSPYGKKGGFAIAVSKDEGTTFETLNAFVDVQGPVSCDGGAGATCAEKWPATHAALVPAVPPADDAIDAAPDASAGDAGRPSVKPRGACGCGLVATENSSSAIALLIAIGFVISRRLDRTKLTSGFHGPRHLH